VKIKMLSDTFCCPVCKASLSVTDAGVRCGLCARSFRIVGGVPDFFIAESAGEDIDAPNKTWLNPEIVQARDTVYRLCARELRGMAFCMQEIGRRTHLGCRILEAGMGTGHFTRWLAEVAEPGTEIYAFDFSWPIIDRAKANTDGIPGITLFRANARAALPFESESFDILFLRLAPLGAHGVPNVQAAFELLRPGGWYFEACWKKDRFETPPTEWAIQHGYESAEYYTWQYRRVQTVQEYTAMQTEMAHLAQMAEGNKLADKVRDTMLNQGDDHEKDGDLLKMTYESLLIAQKPC
jgi:SAM-dependent methyltransferase